MENAAVVCVFAHSVAFLHVTGGQTSEGVLANFFNSLLTKKAGSPGPGQPAGGGSNTPGTVRKSGRDNHLTSTATSSHTLLLQDILNVRRSSQAVYKVQMVNIMNFSYTFTVYSSF